MKKTLLAVTILASASVFSIYAQKTKKDSSKQKNSTTQQLVLANEIDSLSYAYGVGTAKQGLNQYLIQLGVIADTATVHADYTKRIESAATSNDKIKLEGELKAKIANVETENQNNINSFLKGMNDRLEAKSNNSAYYSGLEIAGQLTKMSEQFAKQILAKESGSADDLNMGAVVAGIANVIQNQPLLVENSEELMQAKMTAAQSQAEVEKQKEFEPKIEAGKAFLAEISKKPGVTALPSGVLYKIDKEGHGAIPTASDKVKVHYIGTLTNGTTFDSSVERGEPITFGVGQVIPGWTEILQLMPVGSKWTVYIPYNLAYGENGTGPIEPFSNLIFEIELLNIEK